MVQVKIEPSWAAALAREFEQPYFAELTAFIKQEMQQGYKVYPPGPLIFNAFALTPLFDVRVVILGQDPYHGLGQAHGLCFSVPMGTKPPPSLKNIFAEQHQDLGTPTPTHGDLTHWARQGVLLLNATLTVRAASPGSHQHRGWEQFTDAAMIALNSQRQHLVFLLWGKYAQAKAQLIDEQRHLVLRAAHPSPYSAHNGFFGCRHFSQTNAYLAQHGQAPIDWQLP